MTLKLASATLALLLIGTHLAKAQQWISKLPPKPEEELTFKDFQMAFASYYEQNPIEVRQENIKPVFRFARPMEEKNKADIEEYKMFKRWEWFTEPRVYPSGKWNLEEIASIREGIPKADKALIIKQSPQNPLKVTITPNNRILFPAIIWTSLGPKDAVGGTNMGRVNCIKFDPRNSKTIYIGAPNGGIWKSINAGSTWTPLFDAQPTLSVGDIAIDPGNTNILFAATSDAFGYGVPFWGGTYSVGIMKSINGGNSWTTTGLNWTVGQNRTIRRLVIHPSNSKILLAATSNGLYRTVDGGASWTQLWAASTYDVEFQQNNGNIVYATTSQVLKSTNAGASFSPLTATCAGSRYNIKIALSNPKVLYTLCTTRTVQKSIDAGNTWTTMPAPGVTLYGYYDDVIAVSPISDKMVYVAGFNIQKSVDGGNTWSPVSPIGHVDNHCIEFFPGSGSAILFGNDGGLFETMNGGNSWTSLNKTLAITQFYSVGISKTNPSILIGGAQDNGNIKYNAGAFSNITNADGMEGFIDWSNTNTIYASIQYGGLYRSINGGVSFTGIGTPSGGAWVSPWCQDPITANTIYAGTDKVYKSTNQGTTWTPISTALSGIGSFTVLAVADNNVNVIYAGNGTRLYRTTNGGAAWTDITAGLPVASNYLTRVAINDNNPSIAYASFSGYTAGQKVYKTSNGGASWVNISGSLPNMPVDCIVYEKNLKNALYIGTDAGVYYINDGLSDWIPYKWGLPNVIVDELRIHYRTKKIVAATYGRGIWQAPLKPI